MTGKRTRAVTPETEQEQENETVKVELVNAEVYSCGGKTFTKGVPQMVDAELGNYLLSVTNEHSSAEGKKFVEKVFSAAK